MIRLSMLAGNTAPILLFALLAGTVACAQTPRSERVGPAPVAARATGAISQTEPGTIAPEPQGDSQAARRTHPVVAGETLTSIARRYGVAVGDLAQANPELDPDRIPAGWFISLPAHAWRKPLQRATAQRQPGPERWHRVEAGENLYRIAERYQVTVSEIALANGLAGRLVIHPGQELRIPDARRHVTAEEAVPAPNISPSPQPLEVARRTLDEAEAALRSARFEESLGAVRRANAELEAVSALRSADSEARAAAVRSAMIEGTSHAGLGDEEAAIQSFARVLALDPTHTPDRERTSPKIRKLFDAARSVAASETVAGPAVSAPAPGTPTPR